MQMGQQQKVLINLVMRKRNIKENAHHAKKQLLLPLGRFRKNLLKNSF